MPRRVSVITALVALLSFTGGIALAGDFADEAEKFYNRYCASNYVTSIIAFVCHLQDQITNIEETLEAPGPALKAFDANGVEIGLVTEMNLLNGEREEHFIKHVIFDPVLSRFFHLSQFEFENGLGLGPGMTLIYPTTDCSGLGYISTQNSFYRNNPSGIVNSIFKYQEGKYMIVERGSAPVPSFHAQSESYYRSDTKEDFCETKNLGIVDNAYMPIEVTLTFTEPIPLPLRYGIE